MAGRWEDEREWRERDAQFGRGYPGEDDGPETWRDREDRSFGARREAPTGPVFGERESGASYNDSRTPRGGYPGGAAAGYASPIRGAQRSYGPPRGHSEAERNRAYRAAYGRELDSREAYDGDEARYYRAGPDRSDRDDHRETRYRSERQYEDRHHDDHQRQEPRGGGAGRSFLDRAADSVASWFTERRPEDRQDEPRRELGHRGRGPQGYKRPDERITEEAHERLTEDAWLDASNISISVSGGEVTLSGTVTEREAKHRAERLVEDIGGVNHVQNNLRVNRGNFLTRPSAGFGDSVQNEQLKSSPADRTTDN